MAENLKHEGKWRGNNLSKLKVGFGIKRTAGAKNAAGGFAIMVSANAE